jgi:hypothetical protein
VAALQARRAGFDECNLRPPQASEKHISKMQYIAFPYANGFLSTHNRDR